MTLLPRILTYAILGAWAFVCMFPLYWLVVTSLKDESEIVGGPFYFPFIDFSPSLDSWRFVFLDPHQDLLYRYGNSALISAIASVATLLFGSMAVYGLTRFRYYVSFIYNFILLIVILISTVAIMQNSIGVALSIGLALTSILLLLLRIGVRGPAMSNQGILAAILATRILPPIVTIAPLYMIASYTNLLDTRFALIVAYTGANLPVAVWLLYGVFGNQRTHQEEAAMLDGASQIRIFLEIFAPTVSVSVFGVGFLIFTLCWTEYLYAAYIASTRAVTLPPMLVGEMSTREAQTGGDQIEWARLSVVTVLAVLPPIAFTSIAMRLIGRLTFWKQ